MRRANRVGRQPLAAETSRAVVPVRSLGAVLDGRSPALIKMDVEGFESTVLAGAERALADPALLAVNMELNGSGVRSAPRWTVRDALWVGLQSDWGYSRPAASLSG